MANILRTELGKQFLSKCLGITLTMQVRDIKALEKEIKEFKLIF